MEKKIDLDALMEGRRKQFVEELGLSANASWEDIASTRTEEVRQRFVKLYELPPDASWADIVKVGKEAGKERPKF